MLAGMVPDRALSEITRPVQLRKPSVLVSKVCQRGPQDSGMRPAATDAGMAASSLCATKPGEVLVPSMIARFLSLHRAYDTPLVFTQGGLDTGMTCIHRCHALLMRFADLHRILAQGVTVAQKMPCDNDLSLPRMLQAGSANAA